ncbi:Dcm Site-specific DNA methylase [uncultured Caudovirales phage]|uniref:Cytosine-specific methyltransferase n=1 Tax=uncultured Caudovirales phage TaxID=2100421 RepID=A0A6J5S3Z9_9CAUD|nr:Dcm Site-specific DNA methylase [uncultured Caudovirales phage]
MRYLSVCSGMEAASVAWHPLGWKPVGFSEIEPFPCAILKHRFPNVPNYGSLTEYKQWPLEPGAIDLLVGGTPCQSFSVAGLRKGITDPRGNLALTFLGLADKLKPKWIVWENVPGVLSSGGGRDFGSFLGALVELGYGFAYRVLDAQHFGVPQRRRRVFVVACLGDWRAAAEVLSLGEGLRGYLEAGGKKRKGVAADAGSGVEAGSILWSGSDQANAERVVDKAGTLNCDQGQRGVFICPIGLASTVGTICADTHPGAYSGQDAYSGRLIPVTKSNEDMQPYTASSFAQYAPGVGTVRASGGDLGGGSETLLTQPVPFRKSKRAQSVTDNEILVLADSSNTLNNFDLGDTRTTHAVVDSTTAISFPPGNLVRKAGPNPSSETFPTLSKDSGDQNPHVATPMAVRRLTPNECLRLQGFPDNWSRIPWKGKPAEECPDGPQYKAAGNSMAVPVMAFIGNRIAEYEAKA